MKTKKKTLVVLCILGLIDMVIPIPILALILIYVVLQNPVWFTDLVQEIYSKG